MAALRSKLVGASLKVDLILSATDAFHRIVNLDSAQQVPKGKKDARARKEGKP